MSVNLPEGDTIDHAHQSWSPMTWRTRPAAQQPQWGDSSDLDRSVRWLAEQPGLVSAVEVSTLRQQLAQVVDQHGFIIQIGDCAEAFEPVTPQTVGGRLQQFERAACAVAGAVKGPVLQVGRIAGQYAKPRSSATEASAQGDLPVYRGALVNEVRAEFDARRADARRLRRGYLHAAAVLNGINAVHQESGDHQHHRPRLWTSHEALVMDYEQPQARYANDAWILTSTHFPWVGARTNQPDGAHIEFMRGLANPVAVKVDGQLEVSQLLRLCAVLDPDRTPGRLSLITRLGATAVHTRLPVLVRAVHAAGHPVSWICDPMHGNTVVNVDGRKTRRLPDVLEEIHGFFEAVTDSGGHPAGIHLEATPEDVTECVGGPQGITDTDLRRRYLTTCDPRLNGIQTDHVIRTTAGLLRNI